MQRLNNVFDVVLLLYECYTNVVCLLGSGRTLPFLSQHISVCSASWLELSHGVLTSLAEKGLDVTPPPPHPSPSFILHTHRQQPIYQIHSSSGHSGLCYVL